MRAFVTFQTDFWPTPLHGYPDAKHPGAIDDAARLVLNAKRAGHNVASVAVTYANSDATMTYSVLEIVDAP